VDPLRNIIIEVLPYPLHGLQLARRKPGNFIKLPLCKLFSPHRWGAEDKIPIKLAWVDGDPGTLFLSTRVEGDIPYRFLPYGSWWAG